MIKLELGSGCEGEKQDLTPRNIRGKNGRHSSMELDGAKGDDKRE